MATWKLLLLRSLVVASVTMVAGGKRIKALHRGGGVLKARVGDRVKFVYHHHSDDRRGNPSTTSVSSSDDQPHHCHFGGSGQAATGVMTLAEEGTFWYRCGQLQESTTEAMDFKIAVRKGKRRHRSRNKECSRRERCSERRGDTSFGLDSYRYSEVVAGYAASHVIENGNNSDTSDDERGATSRKAADHVYVVDSSSEKDVL